MGLDGLLVNNWPTVGHKVNQRLKKNEESKGESAAGTLEHAAAPPVSVWDSSIDTRLEQFDSTNETQLIKKEYCFSLDLVREEMEKRAHTQHFLTLIDYLSEEEGFSKSNHLQSE